MQKKDNARVDALSKLLRYEENKIYNKIALLKKLNNKNLISHIREAAAIEFKGPWARTLKKAQKLKRFLLKINNYITVKKEYVQINGKLWLPLSLTKKYV